MRGKFLQDIYLEYFVIVGASWLYFGTDTTQASQRYIALVIFIKYTCKCQNMAALTIESFPYNHCINAALTGFNKGSGEIQSKSPQLTIEIVSECH